MKSLTYKSGNEQCFEIVEKRAEINAVFPNSALFFRIMTSDFLLEDF